MTQLLKKNPNNETWMNFEKDLKKRKEIWNGWVGGWGEIVDWLVCWAGYVMVMC